MSYKPPIEAAEGGSAYHVPDTQTHDILLADSGAYGPPGSFSGATGKRQTSQFDAGWNAADHLSTMYVCLQGMGNRSTGALTLAAAALLPLRAAVAAATGDHREGYPSFTRWTGYVAQGVHNLLAGTDCSPAHMVDALRDEGDSAVAEATREMINGDINQPTTAWLVTKLWDKKEPTVAEVQLRAMLANDRAPGANNKWRGGTAIDVGYYQDPLPPWRQYQAEYSAAAHRYRNNPASGPLQRPDRHGVSRENIAAIEDDINKQIELERRHSESRRINDQMAKALLGTDADTWERLSSDQSYYLRKTIHELSEKPSGKYVYSGPLPERGAMSDEQVKHAAQQQLKQILEAAPKG